MMISGNRFHNIDKYQIFASAIICDMNSPMEFLDDDGKLCGVRYITDKDLSTSELYYDDKSFCDYIDADDELNDSLLETETIHPLTQYII